MTEDLSTRGDAATFAPDTIPSKDHGSIYRHWLSDSPSPQPRPAGPHYPADETLIAVDVAPRPDPPPALLGRVWNRLVSAVFPSEVIAPERIDADRAAACVAGAFVGFARGARMAEDAGVDVDATLASAKDLVRYLGGGVLTAADCEGVASGFGPRSTAPAGKRTLPVGVPVSPYAVLPATIIASCLGVSEWTSLSLLLVKTKRRPAEACSGYLTLGLFEGALARGLLRALPLEADFIADRWAVEANMTIGALGFDDHDALRDVYLARSFGRGRPLVEPGLAASPDDALADVVHAALWANWRARDYEDALSAVATLGGCLPATLCAAGAFAAVQFYPARVPPPWRDAVRGVAELEEEVRATSRRLNPPA